MLEIEGVGFSYGGRSVLHSASFCAGEGEFLALLGMNGAGKSTLLDIVSGFRRPETGSVTIAGRKQSDWTLHEMAQQVSHLPQAVHADLPFTAEQLVAMGRYPHTDRWFESDEDHRIIQQAMQRTRCWAQRHRVFDEAKVPVGRQVRADMAGEHDEIRRIDRLREHRASR